MLNALNLRHQIFWLRPLSYPKMSENQSSSSSSSLYLPRAYSWISPQVGIASSYSRSARVAANARIVNDGRNERRARKHGFFLEGGLGSAHPRLRDLGPARRRWD